MVKTREIDIKEFLRTAAELKQLLIALAVIEMVKNSRTSIGRVLFDLLRVNAPLGNTVAAAAHCNTLYCAGCQRS